MGVSGKVAAIEANVAFRLTGADFHHGGAQANVHYVLRVTWITASGRIRHT
jgi:hypothetical protein